MKKILCGSVLVTLTSLSMANTPVHSSSASPATSNASTTQPTLSKEQNAVQTMLRLNNFTGAYAQLEKMAQNGDREAYYHLATMTAKGLGTKKDQAKAIELYKSAAKLKLPAAQHTLGMIYGKGLNGTTKNLELSKQYFQQAADQGLEQAMVDYGVILLEQDNAARHQEGLKVLAPYIAKGNHQARYHKALYDLAFGIKDKQESQVKNALTEIQALAEAGYAPALLDMGKMLMKGQFFTQDLNEAKKIFTKLNEAKIAAARPLLAEVNRMIQSSSKKK